jgi:hypothetical protein
MVTWKLRAVLTALRLAVVDFTSGELPEALQTIMILTATGGSEAGTTLPLLVA